MEHSESTATRATFESPISQDPPHPSHREGGQEGNDENLGTFWKVLQKMVLHP